MSRLLRRYFAFLVVGSLFLPSMSTLVADNVKDPESSTDNVCHLTDSGHFIGLKVSENIVPELLNCGDFLPDELDIDITYFYDLIHEAPLPATIHPGNFTIYNETGGCDPEFRDIARCKADCAGQIRAYNHDCLSGDDPGVYGRWVSSGCSTAVDAGFTVECCIVD